MTPQVKSLQESKSWGFHIDSYRQDMSGGVSCLYAVSPPLHAMLNEYSDLRDIGKIKLKPKKGDATYIERINCQDCSHSQESDLRFRRKRCSINGNGPMKSCLKSSGNHAKSVTFADARGFALTDVKYVAESTDDPPELDSLDEIREEFENIMSLYPDGPKAAKEVLVADFEQPSANYLTFKHNLESNNVCLENVIFSGLSSINGTVKVKNISYEKRVFVRITFDEWLSYTDHDASFIRSFSDYETSEYDTFQFSIPVHSSFDSVKHRAVFCICYQAGGFEYWDNNSGVNYTAKANVYRNPNGSSGIYNCAVGQRRLSLPNTYCELPGPEFKTWSSWEKKGPFY